MNVYLIWGISNRIQYEEYGGIIIAFILDMTTLYKQDKATFSLFSNKYVMLVIFNKCAINQNHCSKVSHVNSSLPYLVHVIAWT